MWYENRQKPWQFAGVFMVVIGIGSVGCNIAKLFKKYKNYKVIELDAGKGIKKQDSVEAYEENTPKFKTKLKFTDKEVWVFVCGANLVAGATLRILEQIKDKKINIAYIYPDSLYTTPTQMKMNRVVYNVLQEYTRSGLLNSMYLFDNKVIAEIVGNNSITDYYSNINNAIFNCIHTINYSNNIDPVFGSRHEPKEISRIRTVSIGYPEKNEEKLYFLLDNPTETCYIYSMSKKELENSDALTEIRKRVEKDIAEGKKSSFCIFEAAHDTSYFYSIKYSHFIQKENK